MRAGSPPERDGSIGVTDGAGYPSFPVERLEVRCSGPRVGRRGSRYASGPRGPSSYACCDWWGGRGVGARGARGRWGRGTNSGPAELGVVFRNFAHFWRKISYFYAKLMDLHQVSCHEMARTTIQPPPPRASRPAGLPAGLGARSARPGADPSPQRHDSERGGRHACLHVRLDLLLTWPATPTGEVIHHRLRMAARAALRSPAFQAAHISRAEALAPTTREGGETGTFR